MSYSEVPCRAMPIDVSAGECPVLCPSCHVNCQSCRRDSLIAQSLGDAPLGHGAAAWNYKKKMGFSLGLDFGVIVFSGIGSGPRSGGLFFAALVGRSPLGRLLFVAK